MAAFHGFGQLTRVHGCWFRFGVPIGVVAIAVCWSSECLGGGLPAEVRRSLQSQRDSLANHHLRIRCTMETFGRDGKQSRNLERHYEIYLSGERQRVDFQNTHMPQDKVQIVITPEQQFEVSSGATGNRLTAFGRGRQPAAKRIIDNCNDFYLKLPTAGWMAFGNTFADDVHGPRIKSVTRGGDKLVCDVDFSIRGKSYPGRVWMDSRQSHAIVKAEVDYGVYKETQMREFRKERELQIPIKLMSTASNPKEQSRYVETWQLDHIESYPFKANDFILDSFGVNEPEIETNWFPPWVLLAACILAVAAVLLLRSKK